MKNVHLHSVEPWYLVIFYLPQLLDLILIKMLYLCKGQKEINEEENNREDEKMKETSIDNKVIF